MRGEFIDARELSHRVWIGETASEQVPIVALHGFTGTGRDFAPLSRRLDHPFIAPDLIGHGQTDAPMHLQPYRMAEAVAQLEAIVHALIPNKRFILLGYSMGGRTAMHLAPRVADQLAGLVLIGAHPGLTDLEEQRQRRCDDEALAEQIETNGIEWFQAQWAKRPIIATQAQIPPEDRRQMQLYRSCNRSHGLANSLRGMGLGAMPPAWPLLPRIEAPTRFVAGQLDARYAHLGRSVIDTLPRAEMCTVEGAGHCAHLEKTEQTLTVLRPFLSAVRGQTRAGGE